MPAPAFKPTILLIPGGWHPPSSYSPVTSRLSSLSYSVNALRNPSLDSSSKGLADDISHVRSALQTLIDVEGKDVIVISHSYGGLPAIVSVTGYGKSERNRAGKKGGVVGMLFMVATILPAGISQVSAKGREEWLYWPGEEEVCRDKVALSICTGLSYPSYWATPIFVCENLLMRDLAIRLEQSPCPNRRPRPLL